MSKLTFHTIMAIEIVTLMHSKTMNSCVLTMAGIAKATLSDDGIICKFFNTRL
ncbi:hypothetical protein [Chamaesiphon sp.]|uniref:hypothetical protein n=1 Tax=Chamaesiphon sp. TaxID=2814140 RepID=UPI0035936FDB